MLSYVGVAFFQDKMYSSKKSTNPEQHKINIKSDEEEQGSFLSEDIDFNLENTTAHYIGKN